MHGVHECVRLRHFLEQGLSIAGAARQLGVHRATVHRWIDEGLLDVEVGQIRVQYAARSLFLMLARPNIGGVYRDCASLAWD